MVVLLIAVLCLGLPAYAGAADTLLSPKGVNYEVAALMSVKSKMTSENHVLDGWDINSVDPCTWNMVACSADGFVISLEMASTHLSGLLSPSIGNLTHLRSLLVQNNQLAGPIPEEIGNLKELQTLDLSGNQFSGQIPESIGFLSRLNYLRLSKNELYGQIPVPVADLTGLSFLDLSFNNLSGPTPKILAKSYSITGNRFLCTSSSSAQICMRKENTLSETSSSETASYRREWVIPVAAGVSCVFVVSVLLILGWVHWYRSRFILTSYVQQDTEFDIGHLRRFSFRELQAATGNFNPKNILGKGGFGVVYKGCLPNKTMVAVKRLRDPNLTGEVQFQTEVEMIGLALHRNLLRLYGFCMTPGERLLVYPYMPNGSVADRLRDPRPSLDWNKRMRIAMGAARGLLYLHEQCNPTIIHRDVKAANILLDQGFEAVVGDFGLAKLLDRRESHVTTAVRGTAGHIAPEYLSTGQSSEKTDVFGFGILLLEIITGQKAPTGAAAASTHLPKGVILDTVKTLYEEKKVEMVVDRDLRGCFDAEELEKVVELALLCTQANPTLRPKMSEVIRVLEGLAEEQPVASNSMEELHRSGGGGAGGRACSFSNDDYSFTFEAMELSGPR